MKGGAVVPQQPNELMEELHIIGNLRTLDYHKAKHIAQVRHQISINKGYIIIIYIYIQLLIEYYPKQYVLSKCEELLEYQWNIRRDKLKQETTNVNIPEIPLYIIYVHITYTYILHCGTLESSTLAQYIQFYI